MSSCRVGPAELVVWAWGPAVSELGHRGLWPRVLGACRQGSVLGSGAGGRQWGYHWLENQGPGVMGMASRMLVQHRAVWLGS